MLKPLHEAHRLLAVPLRPGARAVDATVGRGRDTAFLARHVGPAGRVLGFDVQADALDAARGLLAEEDLLERVRLVQTGHERAAVELDALGWDTVQAVAFNLGYLPGGDKARITRPDTTRAALDALVPRLAPGGVLTVMVYEGHPGGIEEGRVVLSWAQGLDQQAFHAVRYQTVNQRNRPPWLLVVQRRAA